MMYLVLIHECSPVCNEGIYVQCIGEVNDVVTEAALLGDVQQMYFQVYLWRRYDMPEMLETESELWRRARKKCTIERK